MLPRGVSTGNIPDMASIKNAPKPGRARKTDPTSRSDQVRALLGSGLSVTDIAKKVGCTTGLVCNVKARMSGGAKKGRRGRPRATRGPGRPRKSARGGSSPTAASGLDGILAAVRGAERKRTQMRAALERIQAVIADALA